MNNYSIVAVRQIEFTDYPAEPPFDPDRKYNEFDSTCFCESNPVYDVVRTILYDLQLDIENFNTENWNPFKNIVNPGNTVVIKPNLVIDADNQDAVTTHASVIRPVVDYVWKALQGRGSITICDAPVVFADFEKISNNTGLGEMVEILRTRGYPLILRDLRVHKITTRNNVVIDEYTDDENDKQAILVDLQDNSYFANMEKPNRLSYGSYNESGMRHYHSRARHCYRISQTILAADVVISIPKLKTHKKAGLTCCLKNTVGINVDKNCLPHFTSGPANLGGDEFPPIAARRVPVLWLYKLTRWILLGRSRKFTAKFLSEIMEILNRSGSKVDNESPAGKADTAQRVYQLVTGTDYGGSWSGNETIWRMILDLNRIFLFADVSGRLSPEKQRKVFYIIDGFICGTKNGPLTPHVIKPGLVAAGFNGALLDKAIIDCAGIDARKIPLYREALSEHAGWLHEHNKVNLKINGLSVDEKHVASLVKLEEPSGWNFS